MKKHLLILLLCLALALSACGTPIMAADEPTEPVAAPTEPAVTPVPELAPEEAGALRISELMTKNRATLAADDGGFYDWVELENVSGRALSLQGWALSDGTERAAWPLPEQTLQPGEFCVLHLGGAAGAPFSLSSEDELRLYAPSGALADSLLCGELGADEALALNANGAWTATRWASPGFANSDEGYEAFSETRAAGPLVINEVMTANLSHPVRRDAAREDWVELKNVSDAPVSLAGFRLWDAASADEPFALPEQTLQPGETLLIVCGGDGAQDAPFSLDAQHDALYLADDEGLCDYLALHDLPVDGSCGRVDGRGGFFYFTQPTPGADNAESFRMVSEAPQAVTADGVYNGVDSLSVALSAPGVIHYSTNGSRPGTASPVLDESLTLAKTTVLRAVAIEEGKAPSRVVTFNYLINENHSLPVVCLSADEPSAFDGMYKSGLKTKELPGNLALYTPDRQFSQNCGIQMSGSGSLDLPKKSMALMFRGCYGDGNVDCDVFDSGVNKYASLQLRAGEAYPTTIIQSDLFQEACLAMDSRTLTQHSQYCVLYVNGKYYGIYCLKEKFSAQYYASLRGVSKSSVTVLKYPAAKDSAFSELLNFCESADLTDEAQYERFCRLVDVDSLIDWYLIEGLSSNPDIGGNARLFSSTEDGGRWSFALYDLDWGYNSSNFFWNLTADNYYHYGQAQALMKAAMRSEIFRDRILMRYAEIYDTALSNQSFLDRIDACEQLLAPEVARDRALWGGTEELWHKKLEQLRAFIRSNDPEHKGVENFCRIWDISPETREQYFGW